MKAQDQIVELSEDTLGLVAGGLGSCIDPDGKPPLPATAIHSADVELNCWQGISNGT